MMMTMSRIPKSTKKASSWTRYEEPDHWKGWQWGEFILHPAAFLGKATLWRLTDGEREYSFSASSVGGAKDHALRILDSTAV